MDLASLSTATDAQAMTLRNPATREPIATDGKLVQFMIISRDHPDFRAFIRKRRDKLAAGPVREALTSEQQESEYADSLSALVKDVRNLVLDGKAFAYTPAAFRALLTDDRFPWIASQIDDFASDRANFIKG